MFIAFIPVSAGNLINFMHWLACLDSVSRLLERWLDKNGRVHSYWLRLRLLIVADPLRALGMDKCAIKSCATLLVCCKSASSVLTSPEAYSGSPTSASTRKVVNLILWLISGILHFWSVLH